MKVKKAIKTIKNYCKQNACYECRFRKQPGFMDYCAFVKSVPHYWKPDEWTKGMVEEDE